MDIVLVIIRLALFLVFALAGIGKLLDLEGSKKAVKDFGAPEGLTGPISVALPLAEIVIGLCFLFVGASWVGALGGLLLLLGFIAGMAWQMSKGNAPDCHCFGQIHSEPVSRKSLARNLIFAALAALLVVRGPEGQGPVLADESSNIMQTVLLLVVAAISVVIAFYLKRVFEQQSQILRRLEIIELVSRDGQPVEREGMMNPNDSLPIGSAFPDFSLPNLAGRQVTFENLLGRAKPILFLFVSPTCAPCGALLPEIKGWREELQGKVEMVLVSSGKSAENAEKFGGEFAGDILLQSDGEVSEAVRAHWTPTALFVRADGTIGSHVAAGDSAIRTLVEKVRAEEADDELFYVGNGAVTKIGEEAPAFSLESIDGRKVSSESMKGKKTLAVSWSQTCPHCRNMMEDLLSWDRSRTQADPALIVFASGDRDEHEEIGLSSPIILDEGFKTAARFGMSGTPSAVLIDEGGRIITETAVGAANIWALLGRYDIETKTD